MFFGKIHAVTEYGESVPFLLNAFPGPARMLQAAYMPFRMRHQSEYAPGGVTDAGNALDGAVRVVRVSTSPSFGVGVFKYYHAVFPEMAEHLFVLRDELAFPVRDRKIYYLGKALGPHAALHRF